jgi:hypothetical protein
MSIKCAKGTTLHLSIQKKEKRNYIKRIDLDKKISIHVHKQSLAVFIRREAKIDLRKCFDTATICIKHWCHLLPLLDKSILHMLQQLKSKTTNYTDKVIKKNAMTPNRKTNTNSMIM